MVHRVYEIMVEAVETAVLGANVVIAFYLRPQSIFDISLVAIAWWVLSRHALNDTNHANE